MARDESSDTQDLTRTIALALSIGLAIIGVGTTALQFGIGGGGKLYTALGGASGILGLLMVRSGRSREAVLMLAFMLGGIVTAADVMIDAETDRGTAFLLLPTLTIAVGFVAGERAGIGYALYTVLLMAVSAWDESRIGERFVGPIVRGVLDGSLLAFAGWLTVAIVRHRKQRTQQLSQALDEVDEVIGIAREVANGDLRRKVEGEDELSTSVRGMQIRLRGLVLEVLQGTTVLAPSGSEIAGSAKENEALAREQAAAIQQTRASLEELARAAGEIANTADRVGRNSTLAIATVGEVNRAFGEVTRLYRRIDTLLDRINDVSRKSEILALNAALEGHRAGEAGRGFALVAAQMRQLSDDTREAASDVGSLVADIETVTQSATTAVGSLSEVATDSDALSRRITVATQQQRNATEQLVLTIGDLERGGTELASGAEQTIALADHLIVLSAQLENSVTGYQV